MGVSTTSPTFFLALYLTLRECTFHVTALLPSSIRQPPRTGVGWGLASSLGGGQGRHTPALVGSWPPSAGAWHKKLVSASGRSTFSKPRTQHAAAELPFFYPPFKTPVICILGFLSAVPHLARDVLTTLPLTFRRWGPPQLPHASQVVTATDRPPQPLLNLFRAPSTCFRLPSSGLWAGT